MQLWLMPSTNSLNIRSGVDTLTPAELENLFRRTLENSDSQYFGGLPNRGARHAPVLWRA